MKLLPFLPPLHLLQPWQPLRLPARKQPCEGNSLVFKTSKCQYPRQSHYSQCREIVQKGMQVIINQLIAFVIPQFSPIIFDIPEWLGG